MLEPNGRIESGQRLQNVTGLYDYSPAMQVIGRQTSFSFGDASRMGLVQEVGDIIRAHSIHAAQKCKNIDPLLFAMDCIMLGVIYGKREERRKRKGRQAAV